MREIATLEELLKEVEAHFSGVYYGKDNHDYPSYISSNAIEDIKIFTRLAALLGFDLASGCVPDTRDYLVELRGIRHNLTAKRKEIERTRASTSGES